MSELEATPEKPGRISLNSRIDDVLNLLRGQFRVGPISRPYTWKSVGNTRYGDLIKLRYTSDTPRFVYH